MRHLVAALVILGATRAAAAHPLDVGYLRVAASGTTVATTLELDRSAAAVVLDLPADAIDGATVIGRARALAERTYARAPITTPAGACTWRGATAVLEGRTVRLADTATCPAGAQRWTFPFVAEARISPEFALLLKEQLGDTERLTLVDAATTHVDLASAGAAGGVRFTDFVWSGIEHIGAAPGQWRAPDGRLQLADGIDHILFLLALMLGGGTLWRLLGIASGFTLGHSITLALAALDVVRPPAWLIEPLIALTIVLVAVEALIGRLEPHRWKVATVFGLIHGFGFASALTELDLSTRGMVTALSGYNLGVELGQVAVVLVIAPLVLLAYRDPRIGRLVARGLASAILVLGTYWFAERVVG